MSTENLGPPEQNGYGLSFLETYLSENPESMLFARLADYYLESQRVDEAIRVCEDGIKKHPYYATGHFVLGKSYLANKMYEQAEKEFKRVLLFDPKFLAAHKMYGDLMKEIGWENTCEMSYKKILQIDPLDEVARSVVEAAEAETIDAEPEAVEGNQSEETIQPVAPEKSSPQTESPALVDVPPLPGEQARDSVVPEIDSSENSLGPIAVSPEDEQLLFEEGERLPKKPEDTIDAPQVVEDKPLNERKAEEFSYILDDIFKDEVVEQSSSAKIPPQTSSSAQPVHSTANDEPEATLAELDVPAETEKMTETKSNLPATISESEAPVQPVVKTRPVESPDLTYEPKQNKKMSRGGARNKKGDKMVTPTLGEIYSAQGQYAKAIDVFETLIKKNPDNDFYAKKLEALKIKLDESKD